MGECRDVNGLAGGGAVEREAAAARSAIYGMVSSSSIDNEKEVKRPRKKLSPSYGIPTQSINISVVEFSAKVTRHFWRQFHD